MEQQQQQQQEAMTVTNFEMQPQAQVHGAPKQDEQLNKDEGEARHKQAQTSPRQQQQWSLSRVQLVMFSVMVL